jgi:nucleoside 2-deoxyribosyltransferase
MTTIYVAGPMTGLPEFNYPAFRAAGEHLHEAGFQVLLPLHEDTSQPWIFYMRHALRMVLEADGLALLPGWEASKGATLEVHVATALGLDIKPLAKWLS